jgi:hypothetical protein
MNFHNVAKWRSFASRACALAFISVLMFAFAPPAFAVLYSPGVTLDPAYAPTELVLENRTGG